MILVGPVVAVLVALLRQPSRIAYGATVVGWAVGSGALAAASWHDSRDLPLGYWVAVLAVLVLSVSLCAGTRALVARRAGAGA